MRHIVFKKLNVLGQIKKMRLPNDAGEVFVTGCLLLLASKPRVPHFEGENVGVFQAEDINGFLEVLKVLFKRPSWVTLCALLLYDQIIVREMNG